MKRQYKLSAFTSFTRFSAIVPFFLGGCLAIIAHSRLAQAQINRTLPPPPDVPIIPYGQPQLPQLESAPLPQVDLEFTAPVPNDFGQNFERYSVYVNDYSPYLLQQIKVVEPYAFRSTRNGRSVIQAGVFSYQANAQRRARELESLGIGEVRVVSVGSGQQVPPSDSEQPPAARRDRGYYVAIPTSASESNSIIRRIRQSEVRYQTEVRLRYAPRGTHVSVGPFNQREDAERWNAYIHSIGFDNARVYFGR